MIINSEIKEVLRQFNIPINDGISYLLSIYFDVRPSYTPIELVQKINISNIITLDRDNTSLHWNIPLFEEQITNFEWVSTEWIVLFERKNKDRKGGVKECISRMKKFFAKYPDIRKDEVISATDMYIKSVSNPNYLMTSHYFITKGMGADRTESLLEWVNKYRESISTVANRTSLNNTMQ